MGNIIIQYLVVVLFFVLPFFIAHLIFKLMKNKAIGKRLKIIRRLKMAIATQRERICLRFKVLHTFLPNICYVDVYGLHVRRIIPALKFDDFLETQEGKIHIVRTESTIYQKRRYPLYHVLYNRLYTRTQDEIINGKEIDTEGGPDDLEVLDTQGNKVELTEELKKFDEKCWTPISIAEILKKKSYSQLFHPKGATTFEMLMYMGFGYGAGLILVELINKIVGKI